MSKKVKTRLVAQLHDCVVYEGTPEQVTALVDERTREACKAPTSGVKALAPELTRTTNKELLDGDRCAPGFEAVVTALETFAAELQSEIEWVAELHRHDKTGQARTDQRLLGELKRQALQLMEVTKKTALGLNFGFDEKDGSE